MEIELGAVWRALKTWWWIPVVLVLGFGGIAYGLANQRDATYTATATLVVELSAVEAQPSSVSGITNQLSDSYSLLLETDEFTDRIVEQAGMSNLDPYDISISIPAGSRYLNVNVTSTDAAGALNVANATVDVIIVDYANKSASRLDSTTLALNQEIDSLYAERESLAEEAVSLEASDQAGSARHQQLVGEITRLDQRIADTEARADRMRLDYQLSEPNLVPIKFDTPPTEPTSVQPILIGLLGAFLGGLVGAAFILFWALTNNTLNSAAQWQENSDVRVLSEIPFAGQLAGGGDNVFILSNPTAAPAEGVRMLVTGLDFAGFPTDDKKVLQVTSPGPSDGKSTTSANLAVHFAQLGKRVLLVDCDMHRPSLHTFFSVPNDVGLSNLLMNRSTRLQDVAARVALPGLYFVPSGTLIPNSAELFSSVYFEEAVEQFKRDFDVVILDSPPILLFSDTRRIAARSDAIVAVARLEQTKIPEIQQTLMEIDATGAELLGTILVGSRQKKEHYYYRERRRRRRFLFAP